MAPPSPRRSSRAPKHEIRTQALIRQIYPKRIPIIGAPEDLDDPHILRRRRRAYDDDRDKLPRRDSIEMVNASDEIQEDDEAVRCICGYDDYPGPPPLDPEMKLARDADSIVFTGLDVTDDISGFYVQCDICKVWQHGACVGIMTEESSPDEYFCEKCRKDLHKIHKATNGQRYSTYLPLHRTSRASRSASVAKEGGRSPKNGTAKSERGASSSHSKRRSTMNSREAAYDEEEQLRRAIEASKELAVVQDDGGSVRRNKRGRSDSEENPASVKRQRTSSRSPSPPSDTPPKNEIHDDSDDGALTRNGSLKQSRSSRSQKERSEREERDRIRQEAANKRKGRADRRRGEGPGATGPEKEPNAQADVDSDPLDEGVRSTHKKTKGRNQYTKDRDVEADRSPVRSMSRDTPKHDEPSINNGQKPERVSSKSRTGAHSKISLNELKRRSAAFLDFIAKTQVELASEDQPEFKPERADTPKDRRNGTPQTQANGSPHPAARKAEGAVGSPASQNSVSKAFKEMNCVEMMDLLTRDLVKWQNRYSA
ncbi:unnamed protein product [Parascedosporium putredinis]|uniref:Zinc finger PHD-type domain-containing protein n=1 Tax=Parascedosporium putredinis TaxID=1442378 RepID=A0A9P1GUY0_9PEZI|nr:unnamed protein product [Parascedosporium putredinis]CAI7988117.1 unnamed protein product [Parascedosporium putredinis]